jgi:homocysteine S-methyltransferase
VAGSGQLVLAVGVNCASPADAAAAVPLAAAHSGKPVVVYPNSGESWDAGRRGWTGSGQADALDGGRWIADGARLVGGCCRVRPYHLARLREAIDAGTNPEHDHVP